MRQRAPQRLRDERHDRVEQPQVRVERLDERPPGRLAVCGRQPTRRPGGPWRARGPSRSTRSRSRRTASRVTSPKRVVGHRAVDGRDRRRGARQQPAVGGPEVRRVGQAPLGAVGDRRRPRAEDEPRGVPQLVREVPGVLDLRRPEPLVVARRRPVDEREPERVGARARRSSSSGSTVLPFVFDIFAPYGSRMRPDR